ncbi:MAG: hypothetical protein HC908_09040 [Calothrix sp. SM1_7_51]|nr:hypothetical protein [Calothrix sp. SM1_7_51]
MKIGTKIVASFALGVLMLTLIGLACYQSTNELITASRKENRTSQVLSKIEDLGSQLQNAENGQRGYIITGEKIYLEPYRMALTVLEKRIKELKNLTSDNPNQQRRLNILEPRVKNRLAILLEGIDLRRNQGFEAAQDFIVRGRGNQVMSSIRELTDEMVAEEQMLLKQRSRKAQVAATATLNIIIYGIPISVILKTILGILLTRNISKSLAEVVQVAARLGDGDFPLLCQVRIGTMKLAC